MNQSTRKPGFIVAGAAKSGTTYLANVLETNPKICISFPKEPHFFSNPGRFAGDPARYMSCFEHCGCDQLWGEASTGYLIFQNTIANMDYYGARPKLIFLFREPIARIESHYWHLKGRGLEQRRLLDAVNEERNRVPVDRNESYSYYLQVSSYASNVRPFIEHFGRDRIHFVIFERLVGSPVDELTRLADFLEVQDPVFDVERPQKNAAMQYRHRRIARFLLARNPVKEAFKKAIPGVWRGRLKNRILTRMQVEAEYPELNDSERASLHGLLKDEVEQLRLLIEDSIPEWEHRFC